MDRVKVTTAQNVYIDYEAAGIGDRTVAAIIDVFILFAYFITALLIVGEEISTSVSVILSLPYFFYFLISETFLDGQTIGKKARGIKVTRIDGTEPRFGDYIIRWLFRLIEIDMSMGMIALVALFIRGRGQRLGDMAAGTTVVKVSRNISLKNTLYTEVDSAYTPVFQEAVDMLGDKDISLAKEVMDALMLERSTTHLVEVGEKMKATLAQKMKVTSELSPLDFLQAVITDYNHRRR